MKLLTALLLCAGGLMISSSLRAQFWKKNRVRPSANFTIQPLAPGVWAAIHNNHFGRAICNAGIIDLGDKTLVFDPFMTPAAAQELKETARKLTKKKVSLVVNSHFHNDHIRGNQSFLPNALVISSATTRELVNRIEPEEQKWQKRYAPTMLQALKKRMINGNAADLDEMPYWIGYYEGLIESSDHLFIALADQTFEDSLWIEGSTLSIKLVERRNGHSPSDAVLLIPQLGIAFMGDLLSTERHPWISDGDVDGWKESLRVFYEDTLYHTYVPGHGAVSDKAALKLLYDYLVDIQRLCENATTEAAQTALMQQPIPYPFNSWSCRRFYQPNLQYLINSAREKAGDTSKKEGLRQLPDH